MATAAVGGSRGITVISSTPVQPLATLSNELQLDLRVKRDDLYPFPGGGNKARKMDFILRSPAAFGATALVTNGGVQSNHARVVALTAAAAGMHCHLVLHGDPTSLDRPRGNLLLMMLAGATIDIVPPEGISDAIAKAVARLEAQGERPFVVAGGGHVLAGASAYVEAAKEAGAQLGSWVPDWIVVPSGTGTTQAGLSIGSRLNKWDARVLGVSVARSASRGAAEIGSICTQLMAEHGASLERPEIIFRDEWTAGGYEKIDERTLSAIVRVTRAEGLPLDPTYTGKAFAGLLALCQSGEIAAGSRVLFWHTGGILNLTTSSCFDRPSVS
jgi:1-aminocyclopropane-1-carboxylate deaminase/D-cysteine desulfhydrase-like pyridoxal-dependent ACC family enzyme